MGGICAKPHAVGDAPGSSSSREKMPSKTSSESRSRRGEIFRAKNRVDVIRTESIDKRLNSSRFEHNEKKKEEFIAYKIPKAIQGEQIVAGWPSWLAAVAGEAIHGWVPRRADTFEKLDKIGQGTYSSVYKARDLSNNKIVALKRVRFDNTDPESVKFMAREIVILRKLDHPNIIKLEGLVTSRSTCSLYLVFEYMEHDLSGLASLPGVKFTESQVKCYMQQLLSGLDYCHSHGVLHRDIKASNLLIDDKGILKIADFGLASFFDSNKDVPLTSRVVTLWYRPPELLLGETHYGVAVDLWSTGCILGELYAGKPIMSGQTEVEQLHKIFKLCGSPSEDYWRKLKSRAVVFKPTQPYKRRIEETFKDLPSVAIGLMETLLAIDPSQRGTALFALKSEFFTKPHACDPSSLPNYPSSKEIDAKLRDEKARRQRAEGRKGQKIDKKGREPRVVPVLDANADYVASMQRRHDRANSNSRSGYFKRNEDDTASGVRFVQPKTSNNSQEVNSNDLETRPPMRESYSKSLVARRHTKSHKNYDDISIINRAKDCVVPQLKSTNQMARLSSTKDHAMNDHGYKRNKKIHFSGPLGASNVDQMLKDHDRHIQEAVRRARLDKTRLNKLRLHAIKNPIYTSSHRGR